MKYADVARRLRELNCEELRHAKGSHRVWRNTMTGQVTVIPDWGAKDLTPGTVRGVLRELGLSREQFGPIK